MQFMLCKCSKKRTSHFTMKSRTVPNKERALQEIPDSEEPPCLFNLHGKIRKSTEQQNLTSHRSQALHKMPAVIPQSSTTRTRSIFDFATPQSLSATTVSSKTKKVRPPLSTCCPQSGDEALQRFYTEVFAQWCTTICNNLCSVHSRSAQEHK